MSLPAIAMLAVALDGFTIGAVVLLIVNLLIAIAYGGLTWSLGRLIKQNDEQHKAIDGRIERLMEGIKGESDNRHQSHHELDAKVWGVNLDVHENYQTKVEGMRLYGTLTRQVSQNHRELMDKIGSLPCTTPACPGAKTNGDDL